MFMLHMHLSEQVGMEVLLPATFVVSTLFLVFLVCVFFF